MVPATRILEHHCWMKECLRGLQHMGIQHATRNTSQQRRETDADRRKTCVQCGATNGAGTHV